MHRRDLLRAGGLAVGAATAGCASILGTDCSPGDDHLGNLDARRPIVDSGNSHAVRGTVVGYLGFEVLLDDGTGKALLEPADFQKKVDRSTVAVGDCVTATGMLDPKATRENAMAVLSVPAEQFDDVGDSHADVQPVGDYPTPHFEVHYPTADAVRFVVRAGDGALAGNVFAAHGDGADRWSDLATEVGPDDELANGMSLTVRGVHGTWITMQWRSPDRTWGRRLGRFGGPGT